MQPPEPVMFHHHSQGPALQSRVTGSCLYHEIRVKRAEARFWRIFCCCMLCFFVVPDIALTPPVLFLYLLLRPVQPFRKYELIQHAN